LVGRAQMGHPFDPVDDALADDGRIDLTKAHVILIDARRP
jgi:hypothetical protein